ncbi:MAG: hypothetical protein WD898_03410 [Candidatus Paceibacterota bacterium]
MKKENNIKNLIKTLFEQDQFDRKQFKLGKLSLTVLKINDRKRRKEMEDSLSVFGQQLDGESFFYSAIPFLHSEDLKDLNMSLTLAQESLNLGYERAEALIKAAEDKILIAKGKPQKHGTQTKVKN